MRYLRYCFYLASLSILVLSYSILCTTYGLEVLAKLTDSLLNAEITVDVKQGSLYRGVDIRGFVYRVSDTVI